MYAMRNPRIVTWVLWMSALDIASQRASVARGTTPAYIQHQPTVTRSTSACGY